MFFLLSSVSLHPELQHDSVFSRSLLAFWLFDFVSHNRSDPIFNKISYTFLDIPSVTRFSPGYSFFIDTVVSYFDFQFNKNLLEI